MSEREARPFLSFAAVVGATLVLFVLLEHVLVGLGRLPAAAYEQASYSLEIPLRVARLARARVPWYLLAAGAALVALAVVADARLAGSALRRRLSGALAGWDTVEDGRALRWLVGVAAGVATLALAGHAYNAYFDRAHVADRLLLVALFAATLWRPLFALPFALVASAAGHQLQIPLGAYSWTEIELLVRIPILLGAFWIARALAREPRIDAFVFLLCCLLATTWWWSGWGKLRTGWLTHPHVHLLLIGAHANGWLGFVDRGAVVRAAEGLAAIRVPMMLATLALECGALFMLWRRWTLLAFPAVAIAFHLGAFALTGIFFWKWILLDLALLAFLLRGRRIDRLRIFSRAHFALAVVLIVGQRAWVVAQNLTWFDTPLTYTLRLEAVDAGGGVHELPAGFFRPYTETFVLQTFPYLSPHPQLTGPMGVTRDRAIADALVVARDPAAVFALEQTLATPRFDAARATAFDEFVARSMRTWNRGRGRGALARAGAPRHLWTFPLDANLDGAPAIVRVQALEVTSFYDGRALREIRRRPLRSVDVVDVDDARSTPR